MFIIIDAKPALEQNLEKRSILPCTNFVVLQGTRVLVNIYSAHMDEEGWGDPENFRPERFLDSEGKKVVNERKILPFSIGM